MDVAIGNIAGLALELTASTDEGNKTAEGVEVAVARGEGVAAGDAVATAGGDEAAAGDCSSIPIVV